MPPIGPYQCKCAVCGSDFVARSPNAILCSPACRKQRMEESLIKCAEKKAQAREEREFARRVAQLAKVGGSTSTGSIVYHVRDWATMKPYVSCGHYVYGWYEPGAAFPFYIGAGSGSRAWARHLNSDGTAADCEKRRDSSTHIIILRDRLTAEGAAFAESLLIGVYARMNRLENVLPGVKSQPPRPWEF